VLAIETALLGGPGIEEAQGLGRNSDTNLFTATIGRGAVPRPTGVTPV